MTTQTAAVGTIRAADLDFFVEKVDRAIGVQLDGKGYLVESRLQPVAQAHELADAAAVITEIRAGNRRLERAAIEAMTTNETSFYRDNHPFETLVEHVIPELVTHTGGRLTVWNGACSSGQESYTLAMTIRDHFPDLTKPGRTRIVSTDVSEEMVARTRAGRYSRFEVNRGLPATQAVRHFDQDGRMWVAKAELRDMVDAREVNLLGAWTGVPRCDLVLLRNVLIYFTTDVKRDILRRIRTDVLQPHGCLLLGASETPAGLDDGYEARRHGNTTVYVPKGT